MKENLEGPSLLGKIKEKINKLNKIDYLRLSSLVLAVFIGMMGYRGNRAYAIYSGDERIGLVKTREEGLKAITELEKELALEYEASVSLKEGLLIEESKASRQEILEVEDIKKAITEKTDHRVVGFGLFIDGEIVGVLKSGKQIDEILAELKDEYVKDLAGQVKTIEILEELDVRRGTTELSRIDSKEEVIENIKTGGRDEKIHQVEVGESLYTIAGIYDLDIDELIEANQDLNPENLAIGAEVRLVKPANRLTIATVEKLEELETITREVEIEYDEEKYIGEEEVLEEGKDGKLRKLLAVKRENGKIVEEEILEEKIIEDAEKKILLRGKKEKPSHIATGSFLVPTRGSVSSPYGPRWGRMHRGLDIAAGEGTAILAADGGTISYSAWNGSYGKLVEIDHGNGYKTRYAHCSTIDVNVGDKVAKGERIAGVGNTGRSTGAHLHFEVIKNGAHQNPSNYIY